MKKIELLVLSKAIENMKSVCHNHLPHGECDIQVQEELQEAIDLLEEIMGWK